MTVNETVLGFRLTEATINARGGTVTIRGPDGATVVAPAGGRYVFSDGSVNDADGQVLVDDLLYYSRNHDVWLARIDADEHLMTKGWQEGRDTGGFFDSVSYLAANPDVAASGLDPLTHYQTVGWREGRDPSAFFDTDGYLAANPDVAAAGIDPLEHYLTFGRFEGRSPYPGLLQVQGFDAEYYLATYQDVALSGMDAHQHYLLFGHSEGRSPNAVFDANYYLAHNADVAASGMDALSHYMRSGWKEGRDPSAGFDTHKYQESNPDVVAQGLNPMVHFLTSGQGEGRLARPVDEAPTHIALSASSVLEATPGATVGTMETSDPDGGPFSYAVNDGRFEVVDGVLKLRANVSLDHEAEDSLRLDIVATDSTGLSLRHTVTLDVTDRNEAPTALHLAAQSVSENIDGAVVGALGVSDADAGDTHRYTVSDPRFEVLDGALKLKSGVGLDYEAEKFVDLDVRAVDSGDLDYTQSFRVEVLNAAEPVTLGDGLFSTTVVEAPGLTTTTPQGGSIAFHDPDLAGMHSVTVTRQSGDAPPYGSVTAEVSAAADATTGQGSIAWLYTPHESAIQSLREGETVQETYRLTLTDGTDTAPSYRDVEITVVGTNDVPVVTGQLQGSVTEDTTLETSGQLDAADPDAGESTFVAANYAGLYGTLALEANGHWVYSLTGNDLSAVQSLGTGQSLLDTVQVSTADGTQIGIGLTINGQDEPPPAFDGTFETGLVGWDTLEGSAVELVTGNGSLKSALILADEAGNHTELVAFLGLQDVGSASLPSDVTNGGAIRTSMHLEAGQVLQFDWKFTHNDGGYPDRGLFVLDSPESSTVVILATQTVPNWQTYEQRVDTSADYTIGFAAVNGEDEGVSPTLWVDNLRVVSDSIIT